MTKVYGKCYDEIGAFNDTKYIVGMLERVRLFTCLFVCLLFTCLCVWRQSTCPSVISCVCLARGF